MELEDGNGNINEHILARTTAEQERKTRWVRCGIALVGVSFPNSAWYVYAIQVLGLLCQTGVLLREKKIPFRFISNNTTHSRRFFTKKLNEIGLKISNEEIFTANYAGFLIAKKLKLKNCRLILNKEGQEDYCPYYFLH